jgi:hypothetical protein
MARHLKVNVTFLLIYHLLPPPPLSFLGLLAYLYIFFFQFSQLLLLPVIQIPCLETSFLISMISSYFYLQRECVCVCVCVCVCARARIISVVKISHSALVSIIPSCLLEIPFP